MIIIIIVAKQQILTCLNGARSIVRPAKRAHYLAIFVACARKILLYTRTFSETQQTQRESGLYLKIAIIYSRLTQQISLDNLPHFTFIVF